jgi:hypothetical protein
VAPSRADLNSEGYAKLVIKSFSQREAPMLPPGRTQTLSAGHFVMPHNKALQLTANPLRGFSAAELGR